MCENEKLLVTSNFSFSHSVFKRLVSQERQKMSLCGNGLKQRNRNYVGKESNPVFLMGGRGVRGHWVQSSRKPNEYKEMNGIPLLLGQPFTERQKNSLEKN